MTRGPELRTGPMLLPGLLAVVLFLMIAMIVINTPFASPAGFSADASITSNIGYAMFDMTALQEIDSEPFLASFILAAIVLDAALDASLVLAKREEGGEAVTALSATESDVASAAATDGGTDTVSGSTGRATEDTDNQAADGDDRGDRT